MQKPKYIVRKANSEEYKEIGELMVEVYSQLKGFPKENEQPNYYKMLANIGDITNKPKTEILVAISPDKEIVGAVVFFGDMFHYGSGGIATQEKNSAGFRLLAVKNTVRGKGVGKLLTKTCIKKAKAIKAVQIIIHTTMAMQTAWHMYEKMGFKRSDDLDFMQEELPVFGFRYNLQS